MKFKIPVDTKPEPIKNPNLEIPLCFRMIIDTKEKLPLFKSYDVPILNKSLKDGDYSIEGFENSFSIERKRISDFFSYIGKERKKTTGKLERLSNMDYASLVVEASFDDLLAPQLYTKLKVSHLWGFIKSLSIKYGIDLFMHRNRAIIERYILDRMIYYYELKTGMRQ